VRRLQVDWTRCDGHGLCHALLPEAIDLDEWGFPVVSAQALSDDMLRHARRAAASCPALALRLERA
jgi:ferredoxin